MRRHLMLRLWLILFLVVSLFSTQARAAGKDVQSEVSRRDILKNYSYKKLQEASWYLSQLQIQRIENRNSLKSMPRILRCDPGEKFTETWLMRVKSLSDEALKSERNRYLSLKIRDRVRLTDIASCARNCLCGAYLELIESLPTQQLSDGDMNLLDHLRDKIKLLDQASSLKCARQTTWFCGSHLQQFLQKSSQSPAAAKAP